MKALFMHRPHQENGLYFLTSPILPIVDENNMPCIYKLRLGPDEHKVAVYHLHPNNMDALRAYIFRIIKQNDILLVDWKTTEMYQDPKFYFVGRRTFGEVKLIPPMDEQGNFLPNSDEPPKQDDV